MPPQIATELCWNTSQVFYSVPRTFLLAVIFRSRAGVLIIYLASELLGQITQPEK